MIPLRDEQSPEPPAALADLSDDELRERYARVRQEERDEFLSTLSSRSFLSTLGHLQNSQRDDERRHLETELHRRGLI